MNSGTVDADEHTIGDRSPSGIFGVAIETDLMTNE